MFLLFPSEENLAKLIVAKQAAMQKHVFADLQISSQHAAMLTSHTGVGLQRIALKTIAPYLFYTTDVHIYSTDVCG